ncbi:MAG: hypothetical protein MSG64_02860 [Pyrinomonadaceae bacterium MAG19_C2-C3]|nr:hypothetical protein [Pyrinomonadaceae bacterium MAG19_C2-C3]
MTNSNNNPFAWQTPEEIKAEDVISLFVNVFTDFYNVPKPGHTFLNGPRGSGKSMMFRYLRPDCQLIAREKTPLRDHPFFAIYIPVKSTGLQITELERLDNKHAAALLNEHLMTMYIAAISFGSLAELSKELKLEDSLTEIKDFYKNIFAKVLHNSGWYEELPQISDDDRADELFTKLKDVCDSVFRAANGYVNEMSFGSELVAYKGALCSYYDFLLPLLRAVKQFSFMPQGPIFLLIDDADNLSHTQTMVLNTWVSARTSSDISLKISTQLNYKTYITNLNSRIDAPHDYNEVNISAVYTSTSEKNHYNQRIREIVKKRLMNAGIEVDPSDFFPPDAKQEAAIRKIGEKIKTDFPETGRGYRANDDVVRYARPMYIASLKGPSKSGSTYSYSGFDQLVHISDGVIRQFLEAASQMYASMLAKDNAKTKQQGVHLIDPNVQNDIVRKRADKYLFEEFEKLYKNEENDPIASDRALKLKKLIDALGSAFHHILISDNSERRVFSIAFSDTPDKEVLEVLKLGVRNGYFHESGIGRKNGLGRTRLYILSRLLAPYFLLDPNGFAGYKFMTNEAVKQAMHNPEAFASRIKIRGYKEIFDNPQTNLFTEN